MVTIMLACLRLVLMVIFLAGLTLSTAAETVSRVALVIGNGAYRAAPLRTAIIDAVAMQQALVRLGFEVIRLDDLVAANIQPALQRFMETLSPETIALFYFSGQTARIDGEDYMFAVDAGAYESIDLSRDAISLDQVLQGLATRNARANIVILDTSWNNPV